MFTRFKDFEIRPTIYLDGHTEPNKFDVVKWYDHKPMEVIDWKTGEKKTSTRSCYSIATIWWNEKEPGWEFKSVGTRFIDDYVDGLCEYIKKFLELLECIQRLSKESE